MQRSPRAVPSIGASLIGGLEALLLARLLLRLFAARPDNPGVAAILGLTGPLVAPLRWLDAAQPRFGAVLELSTLACILLIFLVTAVLRTIARRRSRAQAAIGRHEAGRP